MKAPIVITGGAGFIGANLADRLLTAGNAVLIYDNLSRPGVEHNVEWLKACHGDLLTIVVQDVRNTSALQRVAEQASAIYHFAAQIAVTTSLVEPRRDFDVNVGGTLNLLEILRSLKTPPPLFLTSTNKVYGRLAGIELKSTTERYEPLDKLIAAKGVGEEMQLDFQSPYGCSKGAADQYVLDYARSFGIPATVFRMSCIYGPHQFGNEDQGWLAHFLATALDGGTLTIYGDGKQVRDVLFIDDLVNAFLLARQNISSLSGQAFNIGGGTRNTISLIELARLIGDLLGAPLEIQWSDWRIGDQRYYVSDYSKFQNATGWSPMVAPRVGVEHLLRWLETERAISTGAELSSQLP